MRLTEVCFDFFFNPLNPEKQLIKTRDNDSYGFKLFWVKRLWLVL